MLTGVRGTCCFYFYDTIYLLLVVVGVRQKVALLDVNAHPPRPVPSLPSFFFV